MSVLVDTSVWIDYFRSGIGCELLDLLIDENLVVINDLILSELIPFLRIRRKKKVIDMLCSVSRLHMTIYWDEIIDYQYKCLKNGINGIGIPDLIIAQNAKQNNCEIYSFDNHFPLMKDVLKLQLVE